MTRTAKALFIACFTLVVAATAARADDGGPADAGPREPDAGATAQPRSGPRDPALEAAAMEMAGVRAMGAALLTSVPDHSRVLIDEKKTCYTPCRIALPPGTYKVMFVHDEMAEMQAEMTITSGEQVQLHATLGRETPWKLVLPLTFVGGIFTAGGISSIVVQGGADTPADQRRFHRNIGIASIALGLPFLALATYLLATGRPGEVRSSMAPVEPTVTVTPTVEPSPGGAAPAAGASVSGTF
ncbi:MAG: PEGA domain-containing protein [Deltaproteobacteria bacterium]|nr:PEGA domain-containing protein [Deltaproteobacteria bacterium]